MKPKHKRLTKIISALIVVSFGLYLIISSFEDNLIFFYSPNDLKELELSSPEKYKNIKTKKIRMGGLVKEGSFEKLEEGEYEFIITDNAAEIKFSYSGILPPIFREGQGIVGQGFLRQSMDEQNNMYFEAKQLITKHDENYMPPEIKNSLEKYGHNEDNNEY